MRPSQTGLMDIYDRFPTAHTENIIVYKTVSENKKNRMTL